MGFSRSAKRWKREAVPAAFAALTFVTLCFSACPSPLDHSSTSATNGAALTVSFSVESSRTVTASSGDFTAAIRTMAVAVVDGSGATVAEATGIAYGTGVVKTFGSLPPGTYTIKVNAYDATNALIATGSSTVTVAANTNKNVTVDLAYSQDGTTGGLSLELSWPHSTGLADVTATIDGAAVTVSAVAVGATNYTATLTASNLAGGARLLSIYFRTAAGATTAIGPFIETVNIWDGVTSACWIDAGGNPVHTRSFDATEFSASNADLAGLSFTGATLTSAFAAGTPDYTLTDIGAPTISFTATSISGSQDVTYFWNNNLQTWNTSGAKIFNSQNLTWVAGDNTLKIVVTAADRQTTKTYTATFTVVAAANLATELAGDLDGSFVLTGDIDTTGGGDWTPVGSAATPFTGTLDGNGHTITINIGGTQNNAGLIGYLGATGTLKDLTVAGIVSGATSVGALAGYSDGQITGCVSTADVSGTYDVGGLVGKSGNRSSIIEYCYSSGTVTATGGSYVGGLLGENSTYAVVRYCYSVSTVIGGDSAGGLVGFNWYATIYDSYARGAVSGTTFVGGLIGKDSVSSVTRCYETGTSSLLPTGSGSTFVGYETGGGTYDGCYARTAQAPYAGTVTASLPAPWSTAIWGQNATKNDGYPYLLYFGNGTQVPVP